MCSGREVRDKRIDPFDKMCWGRAVRDVRNDLFNRHAQSRSAALAAPYVEVFIFLKNGKKSQFADSSQVKHSEFRIPLLY